MSSLDARCHDVLVEGRPVYQRWAVAVQGLIGLKFHSIKSHVNVIYF